MVLCGPIVALISVCSSSPTGIEQKPSTVHQPNKIIISKAHSTLFMKLYHCTSRFGVVITRLASQKFEQPQIAPSVPQATLSPPDDL
jgi:hypothetical protein